MKREKFWNSRIIRSPREVIEMYVERDSETECWNWTGALRSGYGQLTFRQQHWSAHRFAYTHLVGDIPEGRWVLHHCDNRRCVNPAHLYVGDCKDNRHDALERHRWVHPYSTHTHCAQGHPYIADSFRIAKDGSRVCKACMREHMRRWRTTHNTQRITA